MVDLVFGMAKRVSTPSTASKRRVVIGICVVLAAITWSVFGQTLGHQFVTYDDPQYVSGNPDVSAGISWAGIFWAFTHTVAGNWHPLTIVSHMLDCQLYALNPAGHHFTSVLLHTIAVILLFLVLRQMTGSLWRSGFVAALFAIHPLHVESVAWISERKDVLSAVFFMLTLGAYTRYVRIPALTSYVQVLLLFVLGLMSKPMLVTIPFVLLLLDYWPLQRFGGAVAGATSNRRPRRVGGNVRANTRRETTREAACALKSVRGLVVEKIPMLALSALFSVMTLVGQLHSTGTINELPFAWRLNNASVSYVTYIWQMFWPTGLAAFYPHPNDQLPLWQVVLAIVILVSITVVAFRWHKERPYIFTGWFWYAGMLVPVIGVVQAGEQARADRYSYLPQIGLYILIVWTVAAFMAPVASRINAGASSRERSPRDACAPKTASCWGWHASRIVFVVAGIAIILILAWRASVQTSYWKSSETLWNHTLAVTGDNDVAHNNLGNLCLQRRDLDCALSHFEAALKIRARATAAYYNFGGALIENSVAAILAEKGRTNEAISHYDKAINMRPNYGDPYLNLGNLLFQQGQVGDAIAQWEKALRTQPHDAPFHALLGDAFLRAGSQKIAIMEYERAARISAQDAQGRNNLAWLLATSSDASIRDGNRAVDIAGQAVRLSGGKEANYLRTLAAAFAEAGRFNEAKETARQALQTAEVRGNSKLVNALRDEIALYELGLPYHQNQVPLH